MNHSTKPAICMVFPAPRERLRESISIRINDLIKIVQPSVGDIYIITRSDVMQDITGNNIHYVSNISCPGAGDPIFSVIIGELRAQLQIIRGLFALKSNVKLIFWRGRSSTIATALLVSRLRRKKSIFFIESKINNCK